MNLRESPHQLKVERDTRHPYLRDGEHVDAGAPQGLEEAAGHPCGVAHTVSDSGHDTARAVTACNADGVEMVWTWMELE